jgi:hypothetical protein
MFPNAFIGRSRKPTEDDLTTALGPGRALWDRLIVDLAAECGANVQEWKSYSKKAGWSLCLKSKKRTIIYLSPCQGCFRVALILGDKAVAAARQSRLPRRIIGIINESKRYPEGTGVRLAIEKPADIEIAKQIAAIKLAN